MSRARAAFWLSILVLTTMTSGRGETTSTELCYPGLECSSQLTTSSLGDRLISGPVPGFRFTQTFLIDQVQNLLWSRELYAIGDTTQVFKEVYDGNESLAVAYGKVKSRASTAVIGDLGGWRLATANELNSLLEHLAPTTVYAYFRARSVQLPTRSVLGTVDESADPARISVDGILYADSCLGRARGHIGDPQLNRYGFWLVKVLSPDIEKAQAPMAEQLRQYFEPVDEQSVRPVNVVQIAKREEEFEPIAPSPAFAIVSTTLALNSRFFARYNLKPLPRGALVSAEVRLRGRSAEGAPIPTVSVRIDAGANQASKNDKALWEFAGGTPVGVWQMPGSARLELPEHIVRNAFNARADFYLGFFANVNKCEFEIPEVIVRYVRESNLLIARQLP